MMRAKFMHRITFGGVGLVALMIVGGSIGCPYYNVWSKEMKGKAALAEATHNRQIAIQEAQAKKESAKLLAEAEIERAKGVAEANKIIGDSLQGGEAYLRYLWIDKINSGSQVIYVPTEAGLPILEAGKR